MDSSQKGIEENNVGDFVGRRSQVEEAGERSSTLLSWCSGREGKSQISIQDYRTGELYANIPGVKLYRTQSFSTWTHVKEIPNTNLLISAYYSMSDSANFTIFDISTKNVKETISFEELEGKAGYSEISVNAPRHLMALIPLAGKTAYHLFDTYSQTLLRKTQWIPQFLYTKVSTLDISPDGEKIAIINEKGICVISDIITNDCDFEYQIKIDYESKMIRCRWGEYGEPSLFLMYEDKLLNLLDVEKKRLMLKTNLYLDARYPVTWIDKCPCDSNLLALSGDFVFLFDRRAPKTVKKFDSIHRDQINCVRWNPDGKLLATAADDTYGKVFDLRMEKVIFEERTADLGWAYSVCFL